MSIEMNQYYYELIDEYHKSPNNFVFFVGSGLSVPLFPTWKQLLEKLINDNRSLFNNDEYDEISSLINKQEDYLDISELCINKIGETKYRDLLEKIFDCDIIKDKISCSYKDLFLLSPQIIITTNYDKIPDILCEGKYNIYNNNNSAECKRAIANGKRVVLKLHGDITDQSSIVLTRSDYQKIIFSSESSTRHLLQSLLSTKKIIFLGFSLTDPHINMILENLKMINNNIPISHYLLLNEQSKLKISIYENRFGIKVIPYNPDNDTHPEVSELIKCLNKENKEELITEDSDIKEVLNANELSGYLLKELAQSYKANVSVSFFNEIVSISLTPLAQTNIELQKELLSLLKLFKYKCNDIKYAQIKLISDFNKTFDYYQNQEILFVAKINYDYVINYMESKISVRVLWENIEFSQSACFSNILHGARRINFPFNSQILDFQKE